MIEFIFGYIYLVNQIKSDISDYSDVTQNKWKWQKLSFLSKKGNNMLHELINLTKSIKLF